MQRAAGPERLLDSTRNALRLETAVGSGRLVYVDVIRSRPHHREYRGRCRSQLFRTFWSRSARETRGPGCNDALAFCTCLSLTPTEEVAHVETTSRTDCTARPATWRW